MNNIIHSPHVQVLCQEECFWKLISPTLQGLEHLDAESFKDGPLCNLGNAAVSRKEDLAHTSVLRASLTSLIETEHRQAEPPLIVDPFD